jgi:hypothetical protein
MSKVVVIFILTELHCEIDPGNSLKVDKRMDDRRQSEYNAMSDFVICVDNKSNPASLILGKVYRALPDSEAESHNMLRVIDEDRSEMDGYLYPTSMFGPIELPEETRQSQIRLGNQLFSRKPELPPFSKWTLWEERSTIPDAINSYGVYLFAIFESEPTNIVNPLDDAIVYVGEAKNKFWQGWSSAGNNWQSYFKKHPKDLQGLYVAAACVNDKEEPYRSSYILHLERLLIWKYVERFGRLPSWNKK